MRATEVPLPEHLNRVRGVVRSASYLGYSYDLSLPFNRRDRQLEALTRRELIEPPCCFTRGGCPEDRLKRAPSGAPHAGLAIQPVRQRLEAAVVIPRRQFPER